MALNYRTHFAYRIDMWDADGENIMAHLAGIEDLRQVFTAGPDDEYVEAPAFLETISRGR